VIQRYDAYTTTLGKPGRELNANVLRAVAYFYSTPVDV
jgi:hypothetical protein